MQVIVCLEKYVDSNYICFLPPKKSTSKNIYPTHDEQIK